MKAVVLVGGEGTRLRPLTYATPKPLLPIANRPFLERQFDWLLSHGITDVVLSLGYLPDAFVQHFPGGRYGDLTLQYAVEDSPLDTAGAIRFAATESGGVDERFIVCNGDILTTLDLSALVAFHDARGAEATIALTQVKDPSAFGVVPTTDDGEVVAFVEKPAPGKAPTDWINAGTYVLEPSVLERIPARLPVSIERETFPRMLAGPRALFAMRSDAYWIDIGRPEQYLKAHADLLEGALGTPPVGSVSEIAPGAWASGPVAREPGTTIDAPALFGTDVSLGRSARVERSVLGDGVHVGEGAVVQRSVLHAGARIGADATVIDSVVAVDGVVGDGARALDGSIVGLGASIEPGVTARAARVRPGESLTATGPGTGNGDADDAPAVS